MAVYNVFQCFFVFCLKRFQLGSCYVFFVGDFCIILGKVLDRVWNSFSCYFSHHFPYIYLDLVFGFILDIKSLQDLRLESLRILRVMSLLFFFFHSFVFSGSFFFNVLMLAGRIRVAFLQSSFNPGLLMFEVQELFVMFSLAIERRVS